MKANDWLEQNRKRQSVKWFHERIDSSLRNKFYLNPKVSQDIKKMEGMISDQEISVRKAVEELFNSNL